MDGRKIRRTTLKRSCNRSGHRQVRVWVLSISCIFSMPARLRGRNMKIVRYDGTLSWANFRHKHSTVYVHRAILGIFFSRKDLRSICLIRKFDSGWLLLPPWLSHLDTSYVVCPISERHFNDYALREVQKPKLTIPEIF